ncbi:MAG TPA: hypothetical protein VGE45_12985 [Chloroflexia bacterium]|jgi:uncharacterized membrane protein
MDRQATPANDEPIIVNITPPSIKMVAGAEPVEMVTRVTNAGAARDEYILAIEGIDAAWYTIEDYKLRLSPGDELSVLVTLHPPKENNPKPGTYRFTVSANSKSDPGQVGTTKGTLEISGTPITVLVQTPIARATAGGETVSIGATISNNSSEVDQFAITIRDLDPSWYTLDPESFSLFPGDVETVNVKLHPPLGQKTRSGRYPFLIQAGSLNKPEFRSEASAMVEVEAEGVEVTLQSPSVEVMAGTAQETEVSIRNIGTKADQYTLEIDGIGPDWYKLGFQQASLLPGESKQIRLKLMPPKESIDVTDHIGFVVRARSHAYTNLVGEAEGVLEVLVDPISIKLDPVETTLTPDGREKVVLLKVSNAGQTVEEREIEVQGIDSSWYTLDGKNVRLWPKQVTEVPVKFHLPKEGVIAAGQHRFTVGVEQNNKPENTVEGVITIEPYMDLNATLEPQRITGLQGTYKLRLDNNGNYTVQLELSGRDRDGLLSYGFESVKPAIKAGESVIVPVTIKPGQPDLAEQGSSYQFTLAAHIVGGDKAASKGDLGCTVMGEILYKDLAEEKRKAQLEREAEQLRLAQQAAEIEQKRLVEEARLAEEERKREAERQEIERRNAELARQAAAQREAELARQEEEQRELALAEENKRKAEWLRQLKLLEVRQNLERREEEQRRAEDQQRAKERQEMELLQEAERRRAAQLIEQQRLAAQQTSLDQQRSMRAIQQPPKPKQGMPAWKVVVWVVLGTMFLCACFALILMLQSQRS